ncbi:hypothetical protein PHLGIDRAFT_114548 [Phlebiopsis gigantea 11061_1 CR5-6]|uniref:DNA-binding protein RAP1 n=1 Tax=Phlebiopsis gigantea (strain 11061_1 CR5-6) TaxID=745531 RepID=A0A0C3S5R6_PHLG1|nr:hypothetical protein PHLGIDRAFT_114548 [Phlebiopsis gigantea 11061_1 CR5-6]
MNNGFNQLQGILQMAAFFQNPPANSPLPSSAQASQYQPSAPTTQPVPTQGGPNLLSLLGGHGNTLSAPLLRTLTGAEAGVGSYDGDDELLVKALQESQHKGWTYRRALDNLHGVNSHTAAQWKDYYLDHTPRINKLVALQNGEKPAIAKKPRLDSISPEHRPSSSKHPISSDEPAPRPHSTSRNHRSAVVVKKEARVKASDKGKGREVPSRTPSPPRHTTLSRKGYAFTDEDRRFLINYATYRLHEDPHLKKMDISTELAKKAPHHTAISWNSHWYQQREYYDQFIPRVVGARRKAVSDKAVSESESEEEDDNGSSYHSSEETDEEEDAQNMSSHREPLNDADRRVIARYIASVGSEWNNLRGKERWEPVESMYPQRNYKAWMETYRNHSKSIDELVGKYRRRNIARKSAVRAQKAVPSWAKNRKRARSDDDEPVSKRSREDSSSSS